MNILLQRKLDEYEKQLFLKSLHADIMKQYSTLQFGSNKSDEQITKLLNQVGELYNFLKLTLHNTNKINFDFDSFWTDTYNMSLNNLKV